MLEHSCFSAKLFLTIPTGLFGRVATKIIGDSAETRRVRAWANRRDFRGLSKEAHRVWNSAGISAAFSGDRAGHQAFEAKKRGAWLI